MPILGNPIWLPVNALMLMLYDRGDECTDATGGWNRIAGVFTKETNDLKINTSNTYYPYRQQYVFTRGVGTTVNTIDVTNFSKLHVVVSVQSTNSNQSFFGLATSTSGGTNTGFVSDGYAVMPLSSTETELVLDISSFSGNYYIKFAHYNNSVSSKGAYIYQVWLT